MSTGAARPVRSHTRIYRTVYDVTKFAALHPAGAKIILDLAGTDVTKEFFSFHRTEVLVKYGKRLVVGALEGGKKPRITTDFTKLSKIPHAEPLYEQGWTTPFYTDSHRKWRKALRVFVEKEISPNVDMWETSGKEPPKALFQKMGAAGILVANLGPGAHLAASGIPLLAGVTHQEFDFFHEMILHEEMYRIGAPGLSDGLGCGLIIGLPPVYKFGSKELASRVVPQVLSGDKKICLAISEPDAGSDVAGVQCKAVKSECGTYYTVTGVKKWITNGLNADYFSCAVRTGG